ncbi:hypothetical protein ACGFII_28840 [Micromonospora chalcea]
MRNSQAYVHQVVFRWAEMTLTGNRGVGPVASSMHPGDIDAWRSRLDREIWAAGARGLSYLAGEETAVVVHKLPVEDTNERPGSTLTHVLIGPAAALTAERALGLYDWHGWFREDMSTPADGRLPALDVGQVSAEADHGLVLLRRRAREVPPGPIERLARTLMADPATPLSVLGMQLPVPAVLCGLVDLLGPAYRPWTFATAESSDDGVARPRLIFLEAVPGNVATRPRLSLGWEAPGEDDRDQFLAVYAAAYRRDGLRAIGPVRPRTVFAKSREIASWERESLAAAGVLKSPLSLLHRAGRGDVTDAERDYMARPQVVAELSALLPGLSEPRLTGLLQDWSEGGAGQWPELGDRLVEHALARIVGVPRVSAELRAATAALAPSVEVVHRVVESVLATLRRESLAEQIRRRMSLLGDLYRLRVPFTADQPTVALVLGGVPTAALIDQVAGTSPQSPRVTGVLLAELARRRATDEDGGHVYEAMRRTLLLVPVLQRSRPATEVMVELSGLLGSLFGERANELKAIRYLVGGFDGTIPGPVLGAFRLRAASNESLRLVDEYALRQFYAAEGIDPVPASPARSELVTPAPQAPAPRSSPALALAPPEPGQVGAAAVEEPPGRHGPILVVVVAVGMCALIMITFLLLATYR